jgi:hypothetical protein
LQLQPRIPAAIGLAKTAQLKQAIGALLPGFTRVYVVKAAVQIGLGLLGRVIVFFPLQWRLAGFNLKSCIAPQPWGGRRRWNNAPLNKLCF